jgi:hypothetical protein
MLTDGRVDEAENVAQVRAINGLYNHFMVFVAVIGVLVAINLATGDTFWVHWVIIGWGLGVALHAYIVFVVKPAKIAEAQARLAKKAAAKSAQRTP